MGKFIVTIDGPAGSGKSTLAKLMSERDGFIHINTGAIYRAIALILGENVDRNKIYGLKLYFKIKNNKIEIVYNSEIINYKLQSEKIGNIASKIAQLQFVRDFVNKNVREIAKEGRFVVDGRDCGSIIFPDANIKIYLDASLEERAKRRARQTKERISDVLREIKSRDKQDKNRALAPLIKPKNAIKIDTTDLTIEDVYRRLKKTMEVQ